MNKSISELVDSILLKCAEKSEESGGIPWWLPLVGGLAAGGGAYGLARRISKGPKGSALAKLREQAKGEFYRGDSSGLEGVDLATLSPMKKFLRKLTKGSEVDVDDAESLKDLLKGRAKGDMPLVWQRDRTPVKGTLNPALGPVSSSAESRKAFKFINMSEV